MRSPLASHLHGPRARVRGTGLGVRAALRRIDLAKTNASAIGPPLSRMRVVQVMSAATSMFVKFADVAPAALPAASVRGSGTGSRPWPSVHVVGIAAPPVALPGHVCASAKPWL